MKSSKQKLILIGGGGHCKSCIDVIEKEGRFQISGIVDVPEKYGEKILNYEIFANDELFPELVKDYKNFLITLGQIKTPVRRINLFDQLKQLGASFVISISPSANVSKHAKIEEGSIVMHGATINAAATVGKNCIINTSAIVEHDAVIEDHCHISTACVVNGGSRICKNTFIGSNTVTKEQITIGANSVIGGGLRVMYDLPANSWMNNNENFIGEKK